jgi:hypothetical protein
MENILKRMEDADKQLSKIKSEIESIEVSALAENLTLMRDKLFEKQKITKEAITVKKIELLRIIVAFCSFIKDGQIGYYRGRSFVLHFSGAEDKISFSGNFRARELIDVEKFVREHEPVFYEVCNDMLKHIRTHVNHILDECDNEQLALIELRAKLVKSATPKK